MADLSEWHKLAQEFLDDNWAIFAEEVLDNQTPQQQGNQPGASLDASATASGAIIGSTKPQVDDATFALVTSPTRPSHPGLPLLPDCWLRLCNVVDNGLTMQSPVYLEIL